MSNFSNFGTTYLVSQLVLKMYKNKLILISSFKNFVFTSFIAFNMASKLPWSSRQCVGLLDEKPGSESQGRHQNEIRKVFLRRFPLSRFLAKTLRINKIAIKSFSKNLSFGVDFKLQDPPLMYKINTHNIRGVRNQVNNPD